MTAKKVRVEFLDGAGQGAGGIEVTLRLPFETSQTLGD